MGRVLVAFAWPVLTAPMFVHAQQNSIFYSGQIDGFAGSAKTCLTTACVDQAADAISKLKTIAPGSILVGLGDNFAPDPGPQLQAQMDVHQRLDPQFDADHFRVIDFLNRANYDAVVPGVQDFYFGAQFVRRAEDHIKMVAANLVRTPVQPSTCPSYPQLPAVTILLPNQISTSIASGSSSNAAGSAGGGGTGRGKGGKKGGGAAASANGASTGAGGNGGTGGAAPAACLPSANAELHKDRDPNHPEPTFLWPDANSIYPWTTEIGLVAKTLPRDNTGVYLCTPESPSKPEALDLRTCTKLTPPQTQDGPNPRYSVDSNALGVTPEGLILPYTLQTQFRLLAGATGRLCYTYPAGTNTQDHSCAMISVQEPMFQHAWRAPEGTNYVITGALAPDTLSGLSAIDTTWYENKHGSLVGRQAAVNDPTSAILQALHAYDVLHPGNPEMFGIVLAQMPPSEAKALADSLGDQSSRREHNAIATRVTMIFSAADLVESSPHLTVDIESPAQTQAHPTNTYYIPVFTPAPVFQRTDCLDSGNDPAGCLSIVTPTPLDNSITDLHLVNTPSINARNGPADSPQTGDSSFCADMKSSTPVQKWQCDVLKGMLKDVAANPRLGNSSDIAILEAKSFDFSRNSWAQHPSGPPSAEEAAVILWKSGRLARVSLLGSTLETLLQQNDKLQGQTFQTLPTARNAQQLKILGISKVGSTYYVNGMPLSESQTYSVATSDRLANATSDFPQLAQVDLDNPNIFPVYGKTVQIADIASGSQYIALYGPTDLEGPEPTPAAKKKAPEPKAPSFSYSNRTIAKNTLTALSPLEQSEQLRPMLRFTLEQTALSYSSATPNQSDPSIATNFGGVSNPNVSAAYNKSASALQNARLEWYPPYGRRTAFEDVGFDYLLNVAENVQGSLALPSATPVVTTDGMVVPERVKSLTGNNITFSPFLEFQSPRLPLWKPLVLRVLASDNVAQPLPQYLAGCTAASTLNFVNNGNVITTSCDSGATKDDFQFSLRRTWTLAESVGTRLEKNDFAYFEIGLTHQRSHDVLSAVGVVNAGTAGDVTYFCSLIGAQSLTFCASNLPASAGVSIAPQYSNYSQDGGYVLGLWTTPLMKRVVLQTSGFGNFFAYGNHNQSVLTHYAFNTMADLLVNLPANFSVGPTINEFFFQANSNRTIGSSLIRRTVGAQLNYSFDWHTGVSLKAFYGNSQ